MTTQVSVIIATYNRQALLERLLRQLDQQTLAPQRFEVVVCDDGSQTVNVPEALAGFRTKYRLVPIRQVNAGPAAARHRAIETAQGRVLVIVDDDMQVQPTFLAEHLATHPEGSRRATLGRLAPDSAIGDMPYFERWYANGHLRTASRAREGTLELDGYSFYTGNVSFERADYRSIGGFDFTLRIGEDTDLGLRLEKSGVELGYSFEAVAFHASDHSSEEKWLEKARAYGACFHKLGLKHNDVPHANALRYLFEMNLLARPLVVSSLLAPEATRALSTAGLSVTRGLWNAGLETAAQSATSLIYTMEYMRGVRTQTGSLGDTARAIFHHWRQRL